MQQKNHSIQTGVLDFCNMVCILQMESNTVRVPYFSSEHLTTRMTAGKLKARLYTNTAMSTTLKELEHQARSLSPEERARLADVLLESLRDAPVAEIEAAWDLEIEKRIAAFDRGELATFSAEEVFAEARRPAQ